MNRNYYLLGLLCISSYLYATSNKIEVNAEDINSSNGIMKAKKDVLALVQNSLIKTDNAKFDKNNNSISFDGKIDILNYEQNNISAKNIYLNFNNNRSIYKDALIINDDDFWIYSKIIKKDNDKYKLASSIVSSCGIKNPDWILAFDRSNYDNNSSQMQVYNAKFLVAGVPIFYTPYLSFSTKQERSSGLLMPKIGYSENYGFLYEQPIYYAPSSNWDIELNPQMRTTRGEGIYSTLRFADTSDSFGMLKLGYFKNSDDYVLEHNLKNSEHYGIQFLYDSSKVFNSVKSYGFSDGLYANITLLNDIDYLNLQKDSFNQLEDTNIKESRLNYFLHNDDYYVGLYGKFFIDTTKIDNDDTINELPTLHLHKYIDTLYDEILYSIDLESYNYYRKDGSRAKKIDFKIPITYNKSFFNDYINLSVSQNIYASKSYFTNLSEDEKTDEYNYINSYSQIELSSELTKSYGDSAHIIRGYINYTKPNFESESDIEYEELSSDLQELFSVEKLAENISFGLSQYIYDKKGKLKLYHRLSQEYNLDGENEFGDLRNEIGYNNNGFRIYNNITYSSEHSSLRSSVTTVGYRTADYMLSSSYYYSYNFVSDKSSNIDFNFYYNVNESLKLLGGLTYDIADSYNDRWRFGLNYDRDCWGISALFKQDRIAMLTNTGVESDNSVSFTFQFNIVPFGGFSIGNE